MKKTKKIILFLFFVASVFLSYYLIYFLAENYFFDKIFYQKSYSHGYPRNNFSESNFLHMILFGGNKNEILKRTKDLSFLLDQEVSGDRYNQENLDDKFQIAFIGDSFVYGLGVKEQERASNILEKKLNQVRPTIVYNFGNMGDGLVDNYIKYSLAKEQMDIDLFVFGMVEDDFNFLDNSYYLEFEETLNWLSEGCNKPKTFRNEPLEDQIINHTNLIFRKDEEILSFYLMVLEEKYGNICVAQKIAHSLDANNTLIFNFNYFHPVLMCREDAPRSEINHKLNIVIDEYLNIFKDENIKTIDAYNQVFEFQPNVQMPVSEIEGHPSKIAHYQYAQILFEELISNDKWGFIEN